MGLVFRLIIRAPGDGTECHRLLGSQTANGGFPSRSM